MTIIRIYHEINSLAKYIHTIVPKGKWVDIEFDGNDEFPIFHIKANGQYSNNWNIEAGTPKADSLLTQLGWTPQTLQSLKNKLDAANCISITSSNPVQIGFQRNGMGIYFYDVFNTPLTAKQIEEYNDGCTHIFYKNNIVLEYGGGAIGMQCFEDFTPR